MPRTPDFTPKQATNNGKPVWVLSVPASMSATGKRQRKFFPDKKKADKEAKRLRGIWAKGERAGVVSVDLGREAAKAAELLKPYGISILEAAKFYAENAETKGENESFRTRYERFVAEHENDWSTRYRADMAKVPGWVGDDFMKRKVGGITDPVIKEALRENGAKASTTLKARMARVTPILNQCSRKKRAINIQIMSTGQCARMLRGTKNAAERRAIALLLFAGIRPDGELSRLHWDDVKKSEIYVSPEVSKTSTDRIIPVSKRLKRLLRGHPRKGPVMPPNWARRVQALRRAAGIAGEQDITRHTFASHSLAAFGEDKTKSAMGHTPNSQTLFRHYRRAVSHDQGERFFR